MAKRQGEVLFRELDGARYGENHRRRRLFLPKYLEHTADDERLRGKAADKAYEIVLRWAELETSGKLGRRKETELEGEFLTEVFGEALGYRLFRENESQWEVQAKYAVNGKEADGAIGEFRAGGQGRARAVIELKGPRVNLDRDRFDGRTPVQQLWDYLNGLPECPWGILSNYVSLRLYHRKHTPRAYELFTLHDLRKRKTFEQFYCVLERGGLLPAGLGQAPRAEALLERTLERQAAVGDELYKSYHENRVRLIDHLCRTRGMGLEKSIGVAQKLLDRIVFVAFCEDRGLLPERSIARAHEKVAPFHRVTNPRWQNFRDLFRSIDKGDEAHGIEPFNGGLFREDPEVDDLELEDDWTSFFASVGRYDFRDEVNVEILGHLFERSVHDIERIRVGGFFERGEEAEGGARMGRSAERKRGGIYYTPKEFTEFIVESTVKKAVEERMAQVAAERGVEAEEIGAGKPSRERAAFWRACVEAVRGIKVVDPACGSGAFLMQAYEVLEDAYLDIVGHLVYHEGEEAEDLRGQIGRWILGDNLYGVDLSAEAVEITQLALWIRSARQGQTLADLSGNIVRGNSLVGDKAVDERALDWQAKFAGVLGRGEGGFDCVIGNPPWERMKVQEREFFDVVAPEIAGAVSAAERRRLIARLEKKNPELHARYEGAKAQADRLLEYVRNSGRYPLAGKGDVNTYAVFAELAATIVAPNGRVGLLTPSGIATDHTTREFFAELTENHRLIGVYDFENKAPVFPDVHRSFKFCVLLFGGAAVRCEAADFVFFGHRMADLQEKARHIALGAKDFRLLNPNTRTCPIFRTRRDADLTRAIYRRVPVLVDKGRTQGGNPWGIRFCTMFHQTNDAELFQRAEELRAAGYRRDGASWRKGKGRMLPLYEAKMVQMYDHRAAGVLVKDENWFRQGQTDATTEVQHQNPEFCVEPRWWGEEDGISQRIEEPKPAALLAFKNVTSPTNQRTMIAAFIPCVGVINSAPIVRVTENLGARRTCCLLANLNSFVLDYVCRQKIGNVNLNFFIIEQLPVFGPGFYGERCAWGGRETLEKWVSERVLKLSCTSEDMRPLAEAAGFKEGVHPWRAGERAELMAELDAAYFLWYGVEREEAEYILGTFSGVGEARLVGQSVGQRILGHYDALAEKSCG